MPKIRTRGNLRNRKIAGKGFRLREGELFRKFSKTLKKTWPDLDGKPATIVERKTPMRDRGQCSHWSQKRGLVGPHKRKDGRSQGGLT